MISFASNTYLGNTIIDYFWFAVILVCGLVLRHRITLLIATCIYFLIRRHSKQVGKQKLVQLLIDPLGLFVTIVVVYLAFDRLALPDEWKLVSREEFGTRYVIFRIFHLFLIFSGFWIILRMIDYVGLILLAKAKRTQTLADDQLVIFSKEAIKVLVAGIGLFTIIAIAFELDVVSLITGLGIGGLAFALAAKESLENLLGSFTIFLDKPFVTGDNVRVGTIEGTVESVGFRSTRIRSLDKMLVTVPNKKMVDAELVNDTERIVRRSAFTLLLNHETSEEQLRNVIGEIRNLLANNSLVENGTSVVRFRYFLEKGLEVFIVYIVLTADNKEFMGVQEDINFSIMRILRSNEVQLSQPVTKIVNEVADKKMHVNS